MAERTARMRSAPRPGFSTISVWRAFARALTGNGGSLAIGTASATRKWKPAGLVVGDVFPLGPQRNPTRARADEADRVKKAGGVRFQNGPAV